MGTLGSYLREEREARGLDLRDAAQQTRISVNYLKAIENDDFSRLPGEVFVKGFLKNYAKYLQLHEQDVLRRYSDTKAPAVRPSATGEASTEPTVPAHAGSRILEQTAGTLSGRKNVEPYLWAGVALIACIAVALTVFSGKKTERERTKPMVSTQTSTAALASSAARTFASDKLYLEIEAVSDTWVLVRTDSSPQKKAVLKQGESITWSAYERFLLSYGSIASAVIRLNGRELIVAGPRDMVVRDLVVTAAGIAAQKMNIEQRPRQPKAPLPAAEHVSPARREAVSQPAVTPMAPLEALPPGVAEPAPAAAAPPAPAPAQPLPHE